jgi:hypothetical protein
MKTIETKQNKLAALLKRAAHFLDDGDPVEGVEIFNAALKCKMTLDIRKQIQKARDETDIGNPATAETLLKMLLSDP